MTVLGWTPERMDTLKAMWAKGASASQIANELGGVTRNAVLGKLHRLSLSGRAKAPMARQTGAAKSTKVNTRTVKEREGKPKKRGKPACAVVFENLAVKPIEEVPEPLPVIFAEPELFCNPVRLNELTDACCRWPLWEDMARDYEAIFCGGVPVNGPYCARHARVAYKPAEKRKRAAA